ncbi:MAG: DNA-deoxyinosine glycosylase [Ruminococcus sp.]|nr:DNA-deoxyinosine glycosylase [Ruminococcus sp.]MBQ5311611.1 DNA-deoxyinosine glycosylase [Oscillospiraceae bacterium]
MIQIHPFPPVYDSSSRILILGSFPSVRSREQLFFYGHPQNRFWKMLAGVYDEPLPETVPEKKELLLRHHIALWDVISSCDITGSADSSITGVVPNDLSVILSASDIHTIILNGRTAEKYFTRYNRDISIKTVCLPSTSPANAAWSLARLTDAWRAVLSGT